MASINDGTRCVPSWGFQVRPGEALFVDFQIKVVSNDAANIASFYDSYHGDEMAGPAGMEISTECNRKKILLLDRILPGHGNCRFDETPNIPYNRFRVVVSEEALPVDPETLRQIQQRYKEEIMGVFNELALQLFPDGDVRVELAFPE